MARAKRNEGAFPKMVIFKPTDREKEVFRKAYEHYGEILKIPQLVKFLAVVRAKKILGEMR